LRFRTTPEASCSDSSRCVWYARVEAMLGGVRETYERHGGGD
jgi:hypothetical protein